MYTYSNKLCKDTSKLIMDTLGSAVIEKLSSLRGIISIYDKQSGYI